MFGAVLPAATVNDAVSWARVLLCRFPLLAEPPTLTAVHSLSLLFNEGGMSRSDAATLAAMMWLLEPSLPAVTF